MITKAKDVAYIMDQDRHAFFAAYPKLYVRFVDTVATTSDIFGSQNQIVLLDPVYMPLHIHRDRMDKVLDRLQLEELPEATALISIGVLEYLGLDPNKYIVQPDTLINFGSIIYRIKRIFPQHYLDNYPDTFLHYECILERNTRNNYLNVHGDLVSPSNFIIPVTAQYNVFIGTNSETTISPINIALLDTKVLLSSSAYTISQDGNSEYIYICYPHDMCPLTIYVNGLLNTAWLITYNVVVNVLGVNVTMDVYRSYYKQHGTGIQIRIE